MQSKLETLTDFYQPPWLTRSQRNPYIQLRISRSTFVATAVSLLVHALLLFFLSRQHLLDRTQPMGEPPAPITVLLNPALPQQAAPPVSMPEPHIAPPPRKAAKPRPPPPLMHRAAPPKTAEPPAPPVLDAEKTPIPVPPPPPAPAAPKPAMPDPAQFTDMAAYVNAMREKRHLAGQDADRINEEAIDRQRAPSEDEARIANLKRNLQPSGTNGVFQILTMDAHSAQFAFRGWKNDFSYSRREVYEVDTGLNGDVARAVVRKMIEIIRRYYTGDFNWESPRLGRVVILSARLQDNDGLEDFLLQDFFGKR